VAQIHPTKQDLISLIHSADPAINYEKSDFGKYLATGDEKHLAITGKPTRYIFTPLSKRQRDFVMAEEGAQSNVSVRGYAAVATALHSIEGPDGTVLDERAVSRLRRRAGGVSLIDDDKLWDDESLFPGASVVELGNAVFARSFR
jgi:hypothetical protein